MARTKRKKPVRTVKVVELRKAEDPKVPPVLVLEVQVPEVEIPELPAEPVPEVPIVLDEPEVEKSAWGKFLAKIFC